MKRIIKPIIYLSIIVLIVIGVYVFLIYPQNSVTVGKGQINKVKTMVELCTIDFYNEVAVKDTIANWELFGKQKQRGSISFDIENLQIDADGDTVYIVLPSEIIEIMEATDDNSWESVDSKDLRSMRWADAPTELWNLAKKNAMENSKKLLYDNGTVERARSEGAQSLQMLMEKVYRKPVKVTDPTPKGAHYDAYK
ncbi:MAG: hypothetical protein K2K45_02965 [Muribaculaceae bacterium]|nr:hypothetical protein [Muribaculaceae bacterium]